MTKKKQDKDTGKPEKIKRDSAYFPMGPVFMDSGAFTLFAQKVLKNNVVKSKRYDFFKTDDFWSYVDTYAEWIKENIESVDYYANVDVIRNPEMTWTVQKYLEDEHGLKPVPIIHYLTDLKYLERYINHGYDYVGLGGFTLGVSRVAWKRWTDRIFHMICPKPSKLPIIKTHGFAMTSFIYLRRYPWFSVDSTRWAKAGGFGQIFVPKKIGGEFDYTRKPFQVQTTPESLSLHGSNNILGGAMSKKEINLVHEWLEHINVPLGSIDEDGDMDEYGVVSHHLARKEANLIFFTRFCNAIPEYPWPFRVRERRGFGFKV